MRKYYEQGDVPDFGKFVTDKFVELINEAIHDWPTIQVAMSKNKTGDS